MEWVFLFKMGLAKVKLQSWRRAEKVIKYTLRLKEDENARGNPAKIFINYQKEETVGRGDFRSDMTPQ